MAARSSSAYVHDGVRPGIPTRSEESAIYKRKTLHLWSLIKGANILRESFHVGSTLLSGACKEDEYPSLSSQGDWVPKKSSKLLQTHDQLESQNHYVLKL